jgi:hypothetical protein
MANLNGSMSLADLDTRFQDALRDSSVIANVRANYLKDAYARIWYKHPWSFRHQTYTFTATTANDYIVDGQIDEVADIFNVSQSRSIIMNKGIYMYFDSYADDSHSGPLYTMIDYYEDGPNTHIKFQETPGSGVSGLGVGDTMQVYYCRHIIHNDTSGVTATGTMVLSSDVPSFAPQFHPLIVKEALCEAIKNRRDFQEMYQLTKAERDEMLADMKRRYLTPRRGGRLIIYR